MARFEGTFNEFYQWADARTRFWITAKTRKQRRRVGICAKCKNTRTLTAAHVTPRKRVVRAALGVDSDDADLKLDLDNAWTRIREAHRPFDKAFRFLCEECHRAEDSQKHNGRR
jgi:hypothetical protein